MTTLNEGRNEIRFNNSDGRCLLENWVEERRVQEFDPQQLNAGTTSSAQLFRTGHKGLLTTEFDKTVGGVGVTTMKDSYRRPEKPGVRERGLKAELLEKMLYEKIGKEVQEEFNAPPEAADYSSVTQKDFNIEGFVSKKHAPTAHHDYVTDQPVTFYTEHKEKIQGVTQIKTLDTPFRRNAAFSREIEEYWDQPKPYEHEHAPKM